MKIDFIIKTKNNISLNSFKESSHNRNTIIKWNIIGTLLTKGISIILSFLLIPITIDFINPEIYGIWITLSSIIGWISILDIGLNTCLRNKLTECMTRGEVELAQKYVSTTYAILIIIFSSAFVIFSILNIFINWTAVLNIESQESINTVVIIVFGYFCIRFILSTINVILLSLHRTANASFRGLIEQGASLISIYILSKLTNGSLLKMTLALCVAPIVVLLLFNFTLYLAKYKYLCPRLDKIDFSLKRYLFNTGFKFFIIQIAGIIQFQTSNILIIRNFGPLDVTKYNISYKYFSVLLLINGIIITPLWSAVTEAFTKNDYHWILKIVKKYQLLSIVLICLGVLMLMLSDVCFEWWLGSKNIEIPFMMNFWVFVMIGITVIGQVYVSVLNGISAIKMQYLASVISPLIFLFLSYLFIEIIGYGIESIIIASLISNFNAYLLAPYQYWQIFYKNTKKTYYFS